MQTEPQIYIHRNFHPRIDADITNYLLSTNTSAYLKGTKHKGMYLILYLQQLLTWAIHLKGKKASFKAAIISG